MKLISKKLIKDALAQRKEVVLPPLRGISISVVVFLIIYCIFAWIIGPEEQKDFHFVTESGGGTALSAIFFAMAGSFGAVAFFLLRNTKSFYRFFWLLTAAVFIFFAFDELLEFHERLGGVGDHFVGVPGGFRNWNDIVVIGYGVFGLAALIYFLPEVLRYPRFIEFLIAAFTFYFIHTLIDSLIDPRTLVSGIAEETAKMFCSAFLAVSMFTGLLGVIFKSREK